MPEAHALDGPPLPTPSEAYQHHRSTAQSQRSFCASQPSACCVVSYSLYYTTFKPTERKRSSSDLPCEVSIYPSTHSELIFQRSSVDVLSVPHFPHFHDTDVIINDIKDAIRPDPDAPGSACAPFSFLHPAGRGFDPKARMALKIRGTTDAWSAPISRSASRAIRT